MDVVSRLMVMRGVQGCGLVVTVHMQAYRAGHLNPTMSTANVKVRWRPRKHCESSGPVGIEWEVHAPQVGWLD
jgi:hypothetical protein